MKKGFSIQLMKKFSGKNEKRLTKIDFLGLRDGCRFVLLMLWLKKKETFFF